MHNPESEGFPSDRERSHERYQLTLTRKQIDSLLVAVHRDLEQSRERLQAMASDAVRHDDYDVLAHHVAELESAQLLLSRTERPNH